MEIILLLHLDVEDVKIQHKRQQKVRSLPCDEPIRGHYLQRTLWAVQGGKINPIRKKLHDLTLILTQQRRLQDLRLRGRTHQAIQLHVHSNPTPDHCSGQSPINTNAPHATPFPSQPQSSIYTGSISILQSSYLSSNLLTVLQRMILLMGARRGILLRGFNMLLRLGLLSRISIPTGPKVGTLMPAGRKLSIIPRLGSTK